MPSKTWVASNDTVITNKSSRIYEWIKNNRETFFGSVAIVLAVIAFAIYFAVTYSKLQTKAWQSLFTAQQMTYSGNLEQGQKILGDIVNNYGRTSASAFALLLQGDINFSLGKFKEAETSYNDAIKKDNKTIIPVAMYNIGRVKESLRDLNGAKDAYADFIAKYPEHYMAPEVHTLLARTFMFLNDYESSKQTFEKIAVLYPDTTWSEQAKAMLTIPSENTKKDKKNTNTKKAK